MKNITPYHIYFESSDPLTEQQLKKLNLLLEILFDEELSEDVPEILSEFTQTDLQLSN